MTADGTERILALAVREGPKMLAKAWWLVENAWVMQINLGEAK